MPKVLAAGLALAAAVLAVACGAAQRSTTTTATTTSTTTREAAGRGLVFTDIAPDRQDTARAVAVQPDGKIVVCGTSSSADASTQELVLVRYLPHGSLDHGFGDAGVVRTGDAGYGCAVAVLDDGKILAGGGTIMRYALDGRIDRSFGSAGRVESAFGVTFAVQHGGAIVVGGSVDDPRPHVGSRFRLARYSPDGQPDASFGTEGAATADFGSGSPSFAWDASDYVTAVLIQPDQRIVAIGTASSCGMCDQSRFAVARYTPDGRPDPAFGNDGAAATVVSTSYSTALTGALGPDGKILLAGYWNDGAGPALATFRSDGELDPTFGDAGKLMPDRGLPSVAVAVLRDGRILATGASGEDVVVVRYHADGTVDRTFGVHGKVVTSFSANGSDQANAISIQPDGKIVVAGQTGDGAFALARYTPDGELDPSFGG